MTRTESTRGERTNESEAAVGGRGIAGHQHPGTWERTWDITPNEMRSNMASNAFAISRADCGNPLLTHNGSAPSNSGFLPGLLPKADFGRSTAQATNDDALVRLFRAIGHHNSMSELASVLAAEAAPLIRFDCLGISRRNDVTHAVEWHVAIPGLGMESGSTAASTGHLLTGWAYEQQKPLMIASLDLETRLQSNILQRLPEGIQSVCAVPVTCTRHKLGALFVASMG